MAKFTKLFCVTGLGMLLLCLISCEQKQEPVKAQTQVMKVSKSIDLPKKVINKTDATPGQDKKKDQPLAAVSPSKPGKELALSSAAVPPAVPSGSVTEDKAKQEMTEAESSLTDSPLTQKSYDTKGRVDPFVPLLSEKKDEAPAPGPDEKKPARILTPLEKMELSQIRLVAVIEMKGRSIAMVEEASGKGYEVKLGTYMGKNGGKVSAINKSGLVVKEYVIDFKGNRLERLQEIKFHKSEGGE